MVGADTKVDGGGGVRALRRREEEEESKRQGGKMERTLGLIYKGERISARRENRGA